MKGFDPTGADKRTCLNQIFLRFFVSLENLIVLGNVANHLDIVVKLLFEHVLLPLGDIGKALARGVETVQVGWHGVEERLFVGFGLGFRFFHEFFLRIHVLAQFSHESNDSDKINLRPNEAERPHLFPVELEYGLVRGVLGTDHFFKVIIDDLGR